MTSGTCKNKKPLLLICSSCSISAPQNAHFGKQVTCYLCQEIAIKKGDQRAEAAWRPTRNRQEWSKATTISAHLKILPQYSDSGSCAAEYQCRVPWPEQFLHAPHFWVTLAKNRNPDLLQLAEAAQAAPGQHRMWSASDYVALSKHAAAV